MGYTFPLIVCLVYHIASDYLLLIYFGKQKTTSIFGAVVGDCLTVALLSFKD
jgi:hypothetical protein